MKELHSLLWCSANNQGNSHRCYRKYDLIWKDVLYDTINVQRKSKTEIPVFEMQNRLSEMLKGRPLKFCQLGTGKAKGNERRGIRAAIFNGTKGKQEMRAIGGVQPPNHPQNKSLNKPTLTNTHQKILTWFIVNFITVSRTGRPETARILDDRNASFSCRPCYFWINAFADE